MFSHPSGGVKLDGTARSKITEYVNMMDTLWGVFFLYRNEVVNRKNWSIVEQPGYALTDWQQINGRWYYFEPRSGHPVDVPLYITDKDGVQAPGEF